MPFADYKDFADCVAKNQDKGNPEAYCGKIKHQVEDSKLEAKFELKEASEQKYEIKDPRGDGAVLDDRGQPNIIDYSNQEPMLYQIGENSSHEYPGKIVITNESRYVDREVKRSNIPNVAATGRDATGSDKTQPTLPTGAPYELQKPSHNMHGMNFNTPVDWSKQEVVSIGKGLVARQIGGIKALDKKKKDTIQEGEYSYKEVRDALIKGDFNNVIQEAIREGMEKMFGPPASQAFSDTGNNPHIDYEKLGKPFDEKSDTGDDKTRTGPQGLQPRDNYDSIHYQGDGKTKVHIATPYYDERKAHDVSGIIPELREDIKITIEDPLGDENIPTIELNIKQPELELKKIEEEPQLELKNYPGLKDPDTHTSTIKAGEQSIEDTIPISDIWKEEHGLAEAPASSIDFIKKMFPQLFASGILTMTLTELLDVLKKGNYEQMDLFREKKIEEMQKINPVKFLKFKYNSGKIECPICKPLDGMEFADDDTTRPILPSEKMGEGVYNTHPNCLCTYEEITKLIEEEKTPKSDSAQSRAAAASLRERHDITEEHLRPLQESLNIYKDRMPGEFDWINDEAIENMKNFTKDHPDGRFILAVVSGESYTDHRIEGEDYRRHWTKNELIQNIRTAKHKLTDINHMWQKKDPMSGMIYDANWNFTTDRGEMILWESDPDILNAIRNDIITAASINTGKPRENEKNCSTGECFTEAAGTVLGEDNNVALAYIVTDPQGFKYNGQIIPAMPPGMKFTKLYLIE